MKIAFQRLLYVLAVFVSLQLTSCGVVASSAGRKVLTTIGTEILVQCTLDDCFGKSANASGSVPERSLEQSIQDYYALINQDKYDVAWSYLSPDFRKRSESRGGYTTYVEWWETIDAVSIKGTDLIEGSEGQIFVSANLKYFRNNDKDFSQTLRLSFVWDSPNDRWAIDGVKILSESQG